MDRLGRVEVICCTGEVKKHCALIAVREANVERTEIFVHQLQCDLERSAAALGSMSTILADVTRRSTFQSSSVSLSSAIVHAMAPSLGKAQLRHPHQNIIEAFHHRMLALSPYIALFSLLFHRNYFRRLADLETRIETLKSQRLGDGDLTSLALGYVRCGTPTRRTAARPRTD